MAFSVKYRCLFKVDLLHRFALNKGLAEYHSMSDADKSKQIDSYDFNTFFAISPTLETQLKLNGHSLVFKSLNTGITVWSKVTGSNDDEPFISFANDLSFTFLIHLKDPIFYNYTNLKLENSDKLYCFSNLKPATEPGSFPLINSLGDNVIVDEKFILSDDGVKAELDKLSTDEKKNLFGLIKIAVKGETADFNLTTTEDKLKNPFKTFELLFDNRKTVWRYFFAQDQAVVPADDLKIENGNAKQLITKVEQPLTQKGFVSVELSGTELPNPNPRLIIPAASNKYYSEIYM